MNLHTRVLELPFVAQFFIFAASFMILSVAASIIFRKFKNGNDNEVIVLVLGVFGALYGALLAFVIVIAWQDLQATKGHVAAEAASVAAVVRDANFFPKQVQDGISAAVNEYLHSTVDVDWKEMRVRHTPAVSSAAVNKLYAVMDGYVPQGKKESAAFKQMLADLGNLTGNRMARVGDSRREVPTLLQFLIFGGAICILLLASAYRAENFFDSALLLTLLSLLLAGSSVLVLGLNHPFSGAISVSPEPFFRGILSQYWTGR